MAEKTIKHLQFWYSAEIDLPGGETGVAERIAYRGQTVDITDEYDLTRGEAEDAFMSDAEKAEFDAQGTPYDPATQAEIDAATPPGDFDWDAATPEDMADYMEDNSLNVNQVLEVAHAHPDRLDDILEAEKIVTEDEPRKGVVEGIEKIAKQQSE